METVVLGKLVVLVGSTPEGPWKPVKPEEVPEWLQKPKVLGSMLEGNMAHNPDEGEDSPWYVAVKCKMQQAVGAHPEGLVERIELTPAEYAQMKAYPIGGREDPLKQRLYIESGEYRCLGVPVVHG